MVCSSWMSSTNKAPKKASPCWPWFYVSCSLAFRYTGKDKQITDPTRAMRLR